MAGYGSRGSGFIGFAVGRTDFWQPLVDLGRRRSHARPRWPRFRAAIGSLCTFLRALASGSALRELNYKATNPKKWGETIF